MQDHEGVRLFASSKKAKKRSRELHEEKHYETAEIDYTRNTNLAREAMQATSSGHQAVTGGHEHCLSFRDLGLSEWLDNVCSQMGMIEPTPVQKGCIPAILQGRDVIGVAQTGSGKTAAFALPVLHKLAQNPYGVFCLVLTPTRELAFQLAEQFRGLGTGQTLRDAVIVGGLDFQEQARQLSKRPHVVIATPGRLKAIIDMDDTLAGSFSRTAFLILDEADRLLDASFEPELETILSALPKKRQTLLFSATMTDALITLQRALLEDAFVYQAYQGLQTAVGLKEEFILVPAKVKEVYLTYILRNLEQYEVRSTIVFCGTRRSCENVAGILEELDITVAPLHSGLSQRNRLASLERFKGGKVQILLATDVASRGLDIPEVDLVINYDLPSLASDYVHRVGRTARAGRSGWSLSFISQYDIELVKSIEELTRQQMEKREFDEKDVLKNLSEVYTARRAAAMKASDRKRRKES